VDHPKLRVKSEGPEEHVATISVARDGEKPPIGQDVTCPQSVTKLGKNFECVIATKWNPLVR
jgi:hypothetical protein